MRIEDKATQILNKKIDQIKPEYVKKGQTILGIEGSYEGLDTSDGTITPENIVSGKIGYSQFERVVGTMPQWRVTNLYIENIENMPRNGCIKVSRDMSDITSEPKVWVARTDQLSVTLDYYNLSQAIELTPNEIKKDEDVLGITGTYVSPLIDTNEYSTLLEKTDLILGESGLYKWLEYIQSDGNQFINTELPINSNVKIEIAYEYVDEVDTNDTLLGLVYDDMNYQINFENTGTYVYGEDSVNNLGLNTQNEITTLKIVENKIYKINNTTTEYEKIGTLTKQTMSAPAYLYLFGLNNNGNISRGCAIKLHYCKIYSKLSNKNWNLERHYIPVINKATEEVCLFDRITKVFYENVGTGEFVAGPEKNLDNDTVSSLVVNTELDDINGEIV